MKNIIIIFLTLSFIFTSLFSSEKEFDNLIKKYEKELDTNKIIVSIIDNITNEIIYSNNIELASSYKFEPTSILKPIIMAIVLQNNLLKNDELFHLYNKLEKDQDGYFPKGVYKIGKFSINENKQYSKSYFNYKEILYNSSSIGMLQIAQKLNTFQYQKGLNDFGFLSTSKTQSNNPYLKNMDKYNYEDINLAKATISFGQGFLVTFDELLNAYSKFNKENQTILNPKIQSEIKDILIQKTKDENLNNSFIQNNQIAMYTGSSPVAKKGKYLDKYIANSFGIVNIKDKKYTIGVTIIEPTLTKGDGYYKYANYSSTPLFFEIAKELTKEDVYYKYDSYPSTSLFTEIVNKLTKE